MASTDAWVAPAAKQQLVRRQIDLGPLADEGVEVEVEHCGLCHSDLSMRNDEWGLSRFPAVFGHEVVGRVAAVGPAAKGRRVGQRVGVGWTAGSCMHCRQCLSGDQHLCLQAQPTVGGAVQEPIPIAAPPMVFGQKCVSASPTGPPVAIEAMLEFAARHGVTPQNEHLPVSRINEGLERLAAGKARYRIVLDADF